MFLVKQFALHLYSGRIVCTKKLILKKQSVDAHTLKYIQILSDFRMKHLSAMQHYQFYLSIRSKLFTGILKFPIYQKQM